MILDIILWTHLNNILTCDEYRKKHDVEVILWWCVEAMMSSMSVIPSKHRPQSSTICIHNQVPLQKWFCNVLNIHFCLYYQLNFPKHAGIYVYCMCFEEKCIYLICMSQHYIVLYMYIFIVDIVNVFTTNQQLIIC